MGALCALPQNSTMRAVSCLVVATLIGLAAASDFKELDDKTFAAATEGKNVFVMFQAPW